MFVLPDDIITNFIVPLFTNPEILNIMSVCSTAQNILVPFAEYTINNYESSNSIHRSIVGKSGRRAKSLSVTVSQDNFNDDSVSFRNVSSLMLCNIVDSNLLRKLLLEEEKEVFVVNKRLRRFKYCTMDFSFFPIHDQQLSPTSAKASTPDIPLELFDENYFPRLTELALFFNNNYSLYGLCTCTLSKLEVLDLTNWKVLDERYLEIVLVSVGKNLRRLILENCYRLENIEFLNPANNSILLPEMTQLDLSYCDRLRDVSPLRNCPKLQVLILNQCPRIDYRTLINLPPSIEILYLSSTIFKPDLGENVLDAVFLETFIPRGLYILNVSGVPETHPRCQPHLLNLTERNVIVYTFYQPSPINSY